MSEPNSETGHIDDEAVYRRVVDELFVRLSLYAADTPSGRALLCHLREEVVERALQDVPADSTYRALLVGISNYLMKGVRVENAERGRMQSYQATFGATVTHLQRG